MQHHDNASSILIAAYSRRECIADGFLVDVTDLAKQAGFRVPVAITRAAWSEYVEWTDADKARRNDQDQTGRLWDVLVMCHHAARANDAAVIEFRLLVVQRAGGSEPALVTLKAEITGGDEGEPVVTIMLPDEG